MKSVIQLFSYWKSV